LRRERALLDALRGRLVALSPLTVLSRGYAIVTTETGRVLSDASSVEIDQVVAIRLAAGRLGARVLTRRDAPAEPGASGTEPSRGIGRDS
jgi:exodeoxyribonuclease VII large subunit